jgi:hypothetical protein
LSLVRYWLIEGYGRCEVPPVMRNRAKAN